MDFRLRISNVHLGELASVGASYEMFVSKTKRGQPACKLEVRSRVAITFTAYQTRSKHSYQRSVALLNRCVAANRVRRCDCRLAPWATSPLPVAKLTEKAPPRVRHNTQTGQRHASRRAPPKYTSNPIIRFSNAQANTQPCPTSPESRWELT